GVSTDTRTVAEGQLFIALSGERFDAHDFLDQAVAAGAVALLVSNESKVPAGVSAVVVDDTRLALGRFAAAWRAQFTLPVIAVTGSNGKTTTKEMMAAVLETLGPVLKPQSSFNNQWGLPLTLLQLSPQHRAVALELGSNGPGEIAALAGISRPTVAAVTTVSSAHTEFLGSLDGVQAEKGALVAAIPPEGAVVLNADDPRVLAMRDASRARVLTVSAEREADVRAVGIPAQTEEGLAVTLEIRGARRTARLAFAGRHNVTNALVAAGVGLALGLPLAQIAGGLEAARPPKGRCVWRRAGALLILDDTYNANPVSLRAALDAVAAGHAPGNRLVVVLGDMLELGPITEEAHREAGRAVVAAGAALLVGVGRHMREAVEAARDAGLGDTHHVMTFEDTVAHLLKRLAPGDTVLVKGSRGMRMERVVDALVARLARE
ncbi:MAG TPA: UDP-N-acetylmuramoyl-tripeptide--D-alanyl-D-alanine ligase, partial [Candidatus Rokubacteria bacterium]|nr:UDP-N-acetylmuramoyl-tripeptide--D-alanyl-D-alanine ligase [Candidatus Rokubacteria bacterium]